jgi:hypothetical protein
MRQRIAKGHAFIELREEGAERAGSVHHRGRAGRLDAEISQQ